MQLILPWFSFVSSFFCVIPSEAEGPRIFLDSRRRTSNHGATATTAGMNAALNFADNRERRNCE